MKFLITVETLDREASARFTYSHEPTREERQQLASQYAKAWKSPVHIAWQPYPVLSQLKDKVRALFDRR